MKRGFLLSLMLLLFVVTLVVSVGQFYRAKMKLDEVTKLRSVERELAAQLREKSLVLEKKRAQSSSAEPPASAQVFAATARRNFMNDQPALWNLFIGAEASKWDEIYGPFAINLRLSAEQQEALREVFRTYTSQLADLRAAAGVFGANMESSAELRKLQEALDEGKTVAERRILGDAGFDALRAYERSYPARDMVGGFAASVGYTSPLRPEQAEALTLAIANNSGAFSEGGKLDLNEVNWEAVDREVSQILNEDQLKLWQLGTAEPSRPTGGIKARMDLTRAFEAAKARDADEFKDSSSLPQSYRWMAPLVKELSSRNSSEGR